MIHRAELAVLAGALMLCGCAAQPVNVADLDGRIVCDDERMLAVERAARRNFADVRWVNCPRAVIRVVQKTP